MSSYVRLQLFGIALVCYGGFYDLQQATRGYGLSDPSLGAIVVSVGMVVVVTGLLLPPFRTDGQE